MVREDFGHDWSSVVPPGRKRFRRLIHVTSIDFAFICYFEAPKRQTGSNFRNLRETIAQF